jgi:hypothetical protein
LSAAHKELEVELHGAFARGEFDRLGRFAHWCANQCAAPSLPASWRAALELADQRERLAPGDFCARAEALIGGLPLAATAIGLRHGDPGAMRLLTIAAAISAGPLNAALQASRNQRQYERLVTDRQMGQESVSEPVVVALHRPAMINHEGAPPSVAEARGAARQLDAWRRRIT